MTKEEIAQFIKMEIASMLQETPASIDEEMNFLKMGLSSVQALKVMNRIRKRLEVDINPVAMFEYKTISEFAHYLSELVQEKEVI